MSYPGHEIAGYKECKTPVAVCPVMEEKEEDYHHPTKISHNQWKRVGIKIDMWPH